MPAPETRALTRLDTLRGMRLWNLSSAFVAGYNALVTGQFATAFAISLGANNFLIGFLSAAPMWGQALQLFSPLFIERLVRRKPLCLATYATAFSMWLLIAGVPFVFVPRAQPWAMIVMVVASGAIIALASPASNSWLSDLVPGNVRGRWVARQQSIMLLVTLFATITAGQYIDRFHADSKQAGFIILFLIAVGMGLLSVLTWAYVPEPPKHKGEQRSALEFILLPFRHGTFRNVTLFVAIRGMAVMIAAPFFMVYMLKQLHIPHGKIAAFNAIAQVTSIVANPLWGYLADKFGYKPILRLSSTALAIVPLPWIFANERNYMYLIPQIQAWAGVMSAGVVLGQFNLMLKTAPHDNRSVYIGFYNAVVNIGFALGAQMGGTLADLFSHLAMPTVFGHSLMNLQCVFFISAMCRLMGLSFLKRVREEREVAASVVIEHVRSGNPFVAAWNLMVMSRTEDPATKAHASRALGSAGSLLAVDELIELLDDSDRDVRRAAARALGEIADERAVQPLIKKLDDPLADIVEEAADALGRIPTTASWQALVAALVAADPSVRKSIVLALGNLGDPRAVPTLQAVLQQETLPAILMAATEALSKTGDRRALPRLRRLLRDSGPGVARKQLANSIGNVLGAPGEFYRLLQADAMRQEEIIAGFLHQSRRRLGGRRAGSAQDREYAELNLDAALQRFSQREFARAVACLEQVSVRTAHNFVDSVLGDALLASLNRRYRPTLPSRRKLGVLCRHSERLRMSYALMYGLNREGRLRQLHLEEALLGAFALEQITDELLSLARAGARVGHAR